MAALIPGFEPDHLVTINRAILKPEYSIEDLEERVALLCENVKTYHSDTGFLGGFVLLNSGLISNEGSNIGQAVESRLKDKEALIVTFWRSFEEHEASHRSATFQPPVQQGAGAVRERQRRNCLSHAVVGQGLQPGGGEGCDAGEGTIRLMSRRVPRLDCGS